MTFGTTWLMDAFEPVFAHGASHELARRGALGEQSALLTLYRLHYPAVRALAERLLGSREAAEDLAHDVFERLPRALRGFRAESSLESYLLGITARTARSYIRAATRRRCLEANAALEVNVSTSASPAADSERQELAQLLVRAMDTLTTSQRIAFTLCEIEERSSQEAAEILGEKPGTVRARVFQARKRLRVYLDAQEQRQEGRTS